MNWLSVRILLSFFLIVGAYRVPAQEAPQADSSKFDFIAGKKVIFEDDFSQDPVGKFPSKWRLYPTYSKLEIDDSITNTGVYPIKKQLEDNEPILAIQSDNHYFPIKPKLNNRNYLKDTFTIEFDFRMDAEGCDPAIVFFNEQGDNIFECRLLGTGEVITRLLHETPMGVDYPILPFNYKVWHHFAVSFMHRQIKCYVDNYRVVVIPDCHASPGNFIIAGNSYTDGNPTVAFRKFRYAANIPAPQVYTFNKILTENKFTTHAIHFQKLRSDIEPESMDFIHQLATWLIANPAVKLEIDGYTDNDGDAKANLKLSKDRANAVKAELELLGVDPARLIANGFGESKPIDTNKTPEGKTMNRRVEFIRF